MVCFLEYVYRINWFSMFDSTKVLRSCYLSCMDLHLDSLTSETHTHCSTNVCPNNCLIVFPKLFRDCLVQAGIVVATRAGVADAFVVDSLVFLLWLRVCITSGRKMSKVLSGNLRKVTLHYKLLSWFVLFGELKR